jgi:8-oxo-dGTP pyrophosphatase MutT (NUDIX family)
MKRNRNVPASYLVLFKNNKVLLLKRFNTGYEDGNYSFIAGHVDKGETFTQAIIREAYEEADIKFKSNDLKVIHVMHRKSIDSQRVDVFFTADKWEGKIKNKEPNKCLDLSWFGLDNLPRNIIPYIKEVINKIKRNIFYCEYGWR